MEVNVCSIRCKQLTDAKIQAIDAERTQKRKLRG
jgi:hypothetical protein